MRSFILLIAVLVSVPYGLSCAGPSGQAETPPAVSAKGRGIYVGACVRCHGIDGKGGDFKFTPPVADLTSPEVQQKLDVQLFRAVHEGKANTAMGAWKHSLSDEEIHAVLSYLRQLGQPGATGGP